MATIGNYGSGPYAVRISVSDYFGTDDCHTQRFESAAEAVTYYHEQKLSDGVLFGTCLPKTRQTKANRRLREELAKQPH